MKFIIEENCHNIKVLDAISPYIKIFLDELLKKKELTSLVILLLQIQKEKDIVKL